MPSITLIVRDEDTLRALGRASRAMGRVVEDVAEELAKEVAREGGAIHSELGEAWEVTGSGSEKREVEAPVWWAHFVAGGTSPHGPTTATRMLFEVDGEMVSASFVQGVPSNPFDERAIEGIDHRVDQIIVSAIRRAT